MTTTEPQDKNTAPNKDQAEQTPTWSPAEKMFPLHEDATEAEASRVFTRRSEWERLTRENAELRTDHDTFVEVVKQRDAQEARTLRHFKVAQTVLSQLSTLLGVELRAEVRSAADGLFSRFTCETGTYTVRLVADAVHLDLASAEEGVKPLTIIIDENGLNEAGTLMIIGFRSLTRSTPLPKRAKDVLIQPNPLKSMMQSMVNAGIFGVSSLSFSRPGAQRKGCGMPGCPSCGGRS